MWKEGAIKVGGSWFHYWLKVYDEPSCYGIDEGRISKLRIERKGMVVCNYDRGWVVEPVDEDAQAALQILLFSENN